MKSLFAFFILILVSSAFAKPYTCDIREYHPDQDVFADEGESCARFSFDSDTVYSESGIASKDLKKCNALAIGFNTLKKNDGNSLVIIVEKKGGIGGIRFNVNNMPKKFDIYSSVVSGSLNSTGYNKRSVVKCNESAK